MFIKVKKENSHYYNTLLSNTGFSMLEGWENNYSDLDIPKIWKNASFHNDANPSFAFKGWQIWIDAENVEDKEFPEGSRFHIAELHNYSASTVWFDTDDFDELLDFVNTKISAFIGVK